MTYQIPIINIVNRSTLDMGISEKDLLDALNEYVSERLATAWCNICHLRYAEPGEGWELWMVNDADQPDVLGFHDVEKDGLPRGFVSVKDCLRHEEPVSVVASHELAEMLNNPSGNLGVFTPRGRWIALEVCDPVERETFLVGNGIPVSDFVYPAWFGLPGGLDLDHNAECIAPFEILPGGYIPYFDGRRWNNLFGSQSARRLYAEEDRRLHRTERIAKRTAQKGWLDMIAYHAGGGEGAFA